jgi:hypothetical protein
MAKLKTSFSGHDKFECKIDWITKGLQAYSKDSTIFSQSNIESSIRKLGLGINMIKSLSHWMRVLGLIENSTLTLLGKSILEKDVYLENSDTLWLLHWNLVKNREQSTLVNLFFNHFYPHKFTKNEIVDNVIFWLNKNDIKAPSSTTINSDMDVLIKLYKSNDSEMNMSLFSDLNIITPLSNENYSLNINGTTDISNELFLYILADFIEMQYQEKVESISIDKLERGILSIQKSLCMSENRLYGKIHKLKELTNNKMYYSEASGIRQIYLNESLDKLDFLKRIYE